MVLSTASSVHLCVLLLLVSVSSRVLVHGQIGGCDGTGCRCTASYECCLEVSEGVQNAVVGSATIHPEFVSSIDGLGVDQYDFTVSGSAFLIDPDSGEITTNGAFEREMPLETVECLVIEVQLQLIGVGIVPQSFAVNIEDINDNSPVFQNPEYEFTVPEGEPTADLVCDSNLQAIDRDSGSITYQVISPSSDFTIDRSTTNTDELCISSLIDLDRDSGLSSVSLIIEARDQGGNFSTATVTLTIMDINDNPPEFAEEKINLTVPENQQLDSVITRLEATDRDIDETNSMIQYSLIPPQDAFEINPDNGDLKLKEELNYDVNTPDNNIFEFTVQAVDMGEDPQTGSSMVTITIQDVNEMAQLMELGDPQTEIVEESVEDTVVLAFGIRDLDSPENSNNYLNFLSGGEFFDYTNQSLPNSFTGFFVKQVVSIDREQQSVIELSVELVEGGNPELRRTINSTINILDINDNPPELTQNITKQLENNDNGILIVQLPAIAMDRDEGVNGTVEEYKLISVTGCSDTTEESCTGGKDLTEDFSSLFDDFKTDGLLFAPVLDREEDGRYLRIILELTDGGNMSRSASHALILEILDENDESPTFQQNRYEFTVSEELSPFNVTVGSVTANDRDDGENGTVRYCLAQSSDNFEINPVTGEISSLRSFDRETTPSFTIFITAQDNGDPPNSATNTAEVKIEITDINDNIPTFDPQQTTTFEIASDAEIGSVVRKVSASDSDVGENAAVVFRLEPSVEFTISNDNDNAGCITVAQPLTIREFHLVVTAFNTGQAEGSSLNITIDVTEASGSGLSTAVVIAASAGGVVILLIAISIASICSIVLYCKGRRGKMKLSSIDGSLNNGRPGSPKGILVQIPTATVMRRGSGRVAFDDKVQKMVYDHKQSVTCDEAVYKVESNTNFGSGDESSPRIPHNGSIPSEGQPLANGMPSSLYSHRSRQRSPIMLQEEGHHEVDLSESSTIDDQSHFPYDGNSDEESIMSDDDVSHMNAEIPRFRSPEEHTTGLGSSMRYAPTFPHQQHSSSPLHLVGPIPSIEYHESIPHAYQPPELSDNLTLTPPHSPHSHSHNIPPSTHSPPHPILSLNCTPTSPASYISALNGTNRSNYPIVMPDAFGRGTPDVHLFQDRYMPSFINSDYDTSTYASTELDEALNFPPEAVPGIYSLTDVYSGDDDTV